MRSLQRLFAFALLVASCLSQTLFNAALPTFAPMTAHILERDACPADTFQCPASLGAAFNDVCCANGQVCALDNNQNPACCPSGAVCTGAAPTGAPAATGAVSYVPNSYFSFPYAPTSFDGQGDCRSAKRACTNNYKVCISDLQQTGNGGYAVTINVPGGGGTTVEAQATDIGSSATSVCSSLSSKACSDLEATACEAFSPDSGSIRLTKSLWLGHGLLAILTLWHAC